jgi:hypothetical protein
MGNLLEENSMGEIPQDEVMDLSIINLMESDSCGSD